MERPSPLSRSPILVPTVSASIVGFVSGLVSSGKLSAAQFTCENLHRLPTSRREAYLFQKTKNYRIILGGLKGGLRSGARLGAWTGAFCSLKELLRIPFTSSMTGEHQNWCRSMAGALSGFTLALGASVICESDFFHHSLHLQYGIHPILLLFTQGEGELVVCLREAT
ncbi:hypothetical protein CROQUDRAFT_663372 [Cronartium quercuum f. sp. fusiforme G11]|uniref:Uncharacterized protein n=1 Tax=Cronartium quercuum f. sp. fusiforme G11 TaxID=708437 RepID=A0A9P6N9I2_9BASI|nr:hypothetical protein CROQUDRAFT_663372 [Cronartium quercuum f. sp. fusiforme G11]